jgi:DNA polymerase-1
MTKRLIFDIEADGFLDKVTQIHCICIEDFDTGKMHTFRSDKGPTLKEGVEMLSQADVIIGHNILDYDIPVIKKFYPHFTYKACEDTLTQTRVIWSDLKNTDFALHRKGKIVAKDIGKHGLEAWGQRLGLLKGDFGKTADWSVITDEMVTYCEQDVRVNSKLYHLIQRKDYPKHVLVMEQRIHEICLEQTRMGFPFNVRKAEKLLGKLMARKHELFLEIDNELGKGWFTDLGIKTPTRNVNYKDVLRGCEKEGCEFTKVKYVRFNPNSRAHLVKRLQEKYNWIPAADAYGADGIALLDEEILSKLKYPIAKSISEYLMIDKRLGMLANGRSAWLKLEKNGRIHGRVNTMGAITTRCTHSDPNLAQIPSVGAPYGADCRSLFECNYNSYQVGCDVSGLELRMLAHYMARWDNGDYGDVILNGDIHTVNQEAAGLPTRGMAKTFI